MGLETLDAFPSWDHALVEAGTFFNAHGRVDLYRVSEFNNMDLPTWQFTILHFDEESRKKLDNLLRPNTPLVASSSADVEQAFAAVRTFQLIHAPMLLKRNEAVLRSRHRPFADDSQFFYCLSCLDRSMEKFSITLLHRLQDNYHST